MTLKQFLGPVAASLRLGWEMDSDDFEKKKGFW
jgi:hypothetical protein